VPLAVVLHAAVPLTELLLTGLQPDLARHAVFLGKSRPPTRLQFLSHLNRPAAVLPAESAAVSTPQRFEMELQQPCGRVASCPAASSSAVVRRRFVGLRPSRPRLAACPGQLGWRAPAGSAAALDVPAPAVSQLLPSADASPMQHLHISKQLVEQDRGASCSLPEGSR
jgi:hypothetical protein